MASRLNAAARMIDEVLAVLYAESGSTDCKDCGHRIVKDRVAWKAGERLRETPKRLRAEARALSPQQGERPVSREGGSDGEANV